MFQEAFKFWVSGCHVKSPLPRPHTQDTVTKSCMRQVRTEGAVTWQVLFFLPKVAGFPRPRSHMTWVFGFWYFFLNKSKRLHCRGKVLKQKT